MISPEELKELYERLNAAQVTFHLATEKAKTDGYNVEILTDLVVLLYETNIIQSQLTINKLEQIELNVRKDSHE